jgi:hypothetical protein
MKDANDINQLNIDSMYRKALPAKIDYEKSSPYFVFRQHDVTQHTLRQTTSDCISQSKRRYFIKDNEGFMKY